MPTSLRILGCATVALLAFLLYWRTLLPGLDLGDTGSFQATIGSPVITPRDGYPLYFALGNLFVRCSRSEPERALNLASAVCASLACGVVTWVATELAGWLAAGLFAGLLLASSYTFWTQAIIAEVYALHLLFVALSLAPLLAWARRPTSARLAVFFAVYALGFGNHLSMILLAPGLTAFLLLSHPQGPRGILNARVVALATGLAALGSLPYLWNLMPLLAAPDRPGLFETLQVFWFDVTKTDWRQSMVLGVPESLLSARLGMYWFDLRQQFGLPGIALALLGCVSPFWNSVPRAILLLALYVVNAAFAFSYNVGDAHVFYLPAHLVVALAGACGVGWILGWLRQVTPFASRLAAIALVAYPTWRAIDTYPAVDRSRDRRAIELLDRLTVGLDDRRSILGADLNWQLQNGLACYAKRVKPELAYFRVQDALLHLPWLVRDNQSIGRTTVLTARSAALVSAAYGPLFRLTPDPRVSVPRLSDEVSALPRGSMYVLCLLAPSREQSIDRSDLDRTVALLTNGRTRLIGGALYNAMGGVVGDAPTLVASGDRPYRTSEKMAGVKVEVRMESWLPTDTIRRMGFGHVIVNGRHALTLERGLSFVALEPTGGVLRTAYAAGLYAPQPRYLIIPPQAAGGAP